MSTRTKLLLSALACLLCIGIVLSTSESHQPFALLSPEDLASAELETELGIIVSLSDEAELSQLADILNHLAIVHQEDPEGDVRVRYSISTQDGKTYDFEVYDAHLRIDGISYAADTQALLDFAQTIS